ncbi:hypothetical protein CKO22_05930 [Thiococcus pfennigii]|nr:hypothetical protein [Thiococcus pfennigii]
MTHARSPQEKTVPKSIAIPGALSALVKGMCDVMRRSNCASALQYVPELTWIRFLRIAGAGTDLPRETESELQRFIPADAGNGRIAGVRSVTASCSRASAARTAASSTRMSILAAGAGEIGPHIAFPRLISAHAAGRAASA